MTFLLAVFRLNNVDSYKCSVCSNHFSSLSPTPGKSTCFPVVSRYPNIHVHQ